MQQDGLMTRTLELGILILFIYDGSIVLASPISTPTKSYLKYNQIQDIGYEGYADSSKLIRKPIDVKSKLNQRRLLSTKNESTIIKDDSIGAKIRRFYENDNNMALFCILPLLILIYGGCSVIYCIHKCKKNFKERKQKRQRRSASQAALSSDNVSLISCADNVSAKPKRHSPPRSLSSNSNKVGPVPSYSNNSIPQKLKLDPKSHVKDLLTDYEFFASWVMAQKAADLIQLQGNKTGATSSVSTAENFSRNCGTTIGGRKKKLVFLS